MEKDMERATIRELSEEVIGDLNDSVMLPEPSNHIKGCIKKFYGMLMRDKYITTAQTCVTNG